MLRPGVCKKTNGMALFLVIGTLIIVVILVRVILSLIVSQQRIGRHNVARVQAYYAARAGMEYAFEKLRTGAWYYNTSADNSCLNSTPCVIPESEFPSSIGTFNTSETVKQQFRVIFCPNTCTPDGNVNNCTICGNSTVPCTPPTGYTYCVNVAVKYTSSDIPT
jgi:Tfp pilus assembly protein PilX